MEFKVAAELFEKLEGTTKRLEKICYLRDFYLNNRKEAPLIFDLIAKNYQREIDKKNIGISIKTIFSVISFVSNKSEREIEKKFNKIGDVGKVAVEFINENRHNTLSSKILSVEEIIRSLEQIANTSGTNKNKIKKEILTNLFMFSTSKIESKFLARLLIDDFRIGVSEGVLREACVNALFPQIIEINLICQKCGYHNLNVSKCLKCSETIDTKNQEEISERRYKIVEIGAPKEFIGLDEFIGKSDEEETLRFILRTDRVRHIIKTSNPRNLYNLFLEMFEKRYNTLNSFRKVIVELSEDLPSVIKSEITLGNPLKSMLGTRAKTIEESFEITGKPALMDFKYDGLRVQIHNDKGKVKLFSRNLDEITKQFPEVVKYIEINFSDKQFVMDTECVGFDFDSGKFLPFQMLSRRILTKDVSEVSHIKVVVKAFDLLFIDGETLLDMSYDRRREKLEELFVGRKLRQEMNFDLNKL